jgi:hypothetical protein
MTQWTISLVPELALSAIKIDIPMDSLSRESLPVNYWGFGAMKITGAKLTTSAGLSGGVFISPHAISGLVRGKYTKLKK